MNASYIVMVGKESSKVVIKYNEQKQMFTKLLNEGHLVIVLVGRSINQLWLFGQKHFEKYFDLYYFSRPKNASALIIMVECPLGFCTVTKLPCCCVCPCIVLGPTLALSSPSSKLCFFLLTQSNKVCWPRWLALADTDRFDMVSQVSPRPGTCSCNKL